MAGVDVKWLNVYRISLEMIFRVSVADDKGKAEDSVQYFAVPNH